MQSVLKIDTAYCIYQHIMLFTCDWATLSDCTLLIALLYGLLMIRTSKTMGPGYIHLPGMQVL